MRFVQNDIIPVPSEVISSFGMVWVLYVASKMLSMQYVGSAVIMAAVAALIDEEEEDNRRRRRHRFWVHPIITQREERGQFWTLYEDLRAHEDKFFNYTRMSIKR